MCLAIGPMTGPQRGLYSRNWWRIASRPHRLLLFSSIVHGLVLLGIYNAQLIRLPSSMPVLSSMIIYGLVGFVLLGLMFHRLPVWLNTSSIDYPAYGASYNLGFIGMLLLQIALVSSTSWLILPGLVLLAGAWLPARQALKWRFRWTLRGATGLHHTLLILVSLVPLFILFNLGCLLVSSCVISPTVLLAKDLFLVTLLLAGFIAEFVGFRMQVH